MSRRVPAPAAATSTRFTAARPAPCSILSIRWRPASPHSFKFAATLQECHQGSNPVLIRIDTKAGHGGGKPLTKVLEEQADIYGFIMYNLGMKVK